MRNYPSNISREQFQIIEEDLKSARKRTKPRKVDMYEVFCAVLYVLKSGCQWDMLPTDFPKKSTVYYYFQIWTKERECGSTLLDEVLKKIGRPMAYRRWKARMGEFCIIDAQSVKNTDTAQRKGYDASKKVSGIKRHIAVDSNGLPHAIHITTANISDKAGAKEMIERNKKSLCGVVNVMCDAGYAGKPFADAVMETIGADVEIVRRDQLHEFVVLPKRWIVERTFAWLEKCRRLWKNCEHFLHTSLQMTVLAFIVLLLKRF